VWALTTRKVVSWSTRKGRILLDEPQRWFQAILPAQPRGQAWVVSRDGLLRRIDLRTGSVIESRHVEDVIVSAAGNRQGTAAVAIGLQKNWVIGLTGLPAVRPFQLNDCVEGRPAFSLDSSSIFIPCTQGPIVQLSAASGREVQRIQIPQKGANAVAVAPNSGRLLVGGWGGELFQVDLSRKSVRLLRDNECHASVLAVALPPREDHVMAVGEGTGMLGCASIGLLDHRGRWAWNHVVDVPPNSVLSQAAAFDPTGAELAVGYSDGSLMLRPSENLMPGELVTSVIGAIRDMLVVDDEQLYVVTRAGVLQSVPLCPSCLSNHHLAGTARDRLQRAIQLGLTHR
jgi:hypothetical protein